jgi:hypothetical protein
MGLLRNATYFGGRVCPKKPQKPGDEPGFSLFAVPAHAIWRVDSKLLLLTNPIFSSDLEILSTEGARWRRG